MRICVLMSTGRISGKPRSKRPLDMCADQPGSSVMVEFKFAGNPFSEDPSITFPPFFFEQLVEDRKRRSALLRSVKAEIRPRSGEQVVKRPDAGADTVGAGCIDVGAASAIKDRPLNVCPVTGR